MQKEKEVIDRLNVLLASFQIHYQNLRGFHWNIKGIHFFELHVKFEEWYNDSQIKIDLIAERILMLAGKPLHTFGDYSSVSLIEVYKDVSDDQISMKGVLSAVNLLLNQERALLKLTDELEDEGTNALMSELVAEQEKLRWMLQSWLNALYNIGEEPSDFLAAFFIYAIVEV